MPTAIAPEGFQAQEGFVTSEGPELARAFEAALVLTAGGLNGARTQRLVGEFDLLRGGGAGHNGLSGGDDFLVFHSVSVVLEVFDLGLEFLLLGFLEPRFELGQVGDEVGRLVVTDLLEQRFYPRVASGCLAHRGRAPPPRDVLRRARGPTVAGHWGNGL